MFFKSHFSDPDKPKHNEYEYIIHDDPNEKNTRGHNQRKLDMVVLYYIANLTLADGKPENAQNEDILNFFNRKKDFFVALYAARMQERLREIYDNWSLYNGSAIMKKIVDIMVKVCRYRFEDSGNRPFDVIYEFYYNDQNHEYFSVEKLLDDIGKSDKELNACKELDIFFNDLEKSVADYNPMYKTYLQNRSNRIF